MAIISGPWLPFWREIASNKVCLTTAQRHVVDLQLIILLICGICHILFWPRTDHILYQFTRGYFWYLFKKRFHNNIPIYLIRLVAVNMVLSCLFTNSIAILINFRNISHSIVFFIREPFSTALCKVNISCVWIPVVEFSWQVDHEAVVSERIAIVSRQERLYEGLA